MSMPMTEDVWVCAGRVGPDVTSSATSVPCPNPPTHWVTSSCPHGHHGIHPLCDRCRDMLGTQSGCMNCEAAGRSGVGSTISEQRPLTQPGPDTRWGTYLQWHADDDDHTFLGGTFIREPLDDLAESRAHTLGLAPDGGHVCLSVDQTPLPDDPRWLERLLTEDELAQVPPPGSGA